MDAEMEFEAYSELTPIQNFFYGRSVFITGATGFVGKVLVEKLLRCCPGIGRLYLLVREKRGRTPEERIEKLCKSELFKKVKEVFPEFKRRICLIVGDLEKERLGICDEDLEKLKANVSIVFHSAARLRFDDPLKVAVKHNVIATRMLVDLCHQLPKLTSVVHVSTAFVRREGDGSVLECVPKFKVSPTQLLDAMEWMNENSQQAVSDFLTGKESNTYLVTKALAEAEVEQRRGDLLTAIVRPAYICPTLQDPFPGWSDALQGVSGLVLASAKGVLRTLYTVEDLKISLIPVDVVVNTMIVASWHIAIERPSSTFIVNCVVNHEKLPYANDVLLKVCLDKMYKYPLSYSFRSPNFTIYYKKFPYIVHSLIDEWIPAYIVDFLLYVFTGKTVLVKIYKKIHFLYDIFFRIGRIPWKCRLENYNAMKKSLAEKDQEIFSMDTDNLDWAKYMDDCLYGGRKYIAKEDPSNLPYARRNANIWWFVSTFMKYGFILLVLYYFIPKPFIKRLFGSSERKNAAAYSPFTIGF